MNLVYIIDAVLGGQDFESFIHLPFCLYNLHIFFKNSIYTRKMQIVRY